MSATWPCVVAAVLVILGALKAAMSDMVQEEARTRLSRIPFALIRMAGMRVPAGLRDEVVPEWEAELEHIVSETEGLPLTRLLRGIGFAASLLLSARAVARGLTTGSGGRDIVVLLMQFAGRVMAVFGAALICAALCEAAAGHAPQPLALGLATCSWLVVTGTLFSLRRPEVALALTAATITIVFCVQDPSIFNIAAAVALFACLAIAQAVNVISRREQKRTGQNGR